jgi:hypothetical protein
MGWSGELLGDLKPVAVFFNGLETDGKLREVVARINGRFRICGMWT